jgi:hypothetical protein
MPNISFTKDEVSMIHYLARNIGNQITRSDDARTLDRIKAKTQKYI